MVIRDEPEKRPRSQVQLEEPELQRCNMKQLSIVLLSLFCIFFIMAPLYVLSLIVKLYLSRTTTWILNRGTDIIVIRVGAITSRRRSRHLNAAEPGPKQLQRAQRKLSTVTACSTIGTSSNLDRSSSNCKTEHDDVEATAAQLELGEW